jgi:hypothetical protein
MADDASERAKLGGDAYLGLVCHRGLIADEPDSSVADSASHVQRRSALAVMGEVYPVGSFKGLTVLPVNHLDWEKETGHRPEQDVPSWWPGTNAASGRLTPFSALSERK